MSPRHFLSDVLLVLGFGTGFSLDNLEVLAHIELWLRVAFYALSVVAVCLSIYFRLYPRKKRGPAD